MYAIRSYYVKKESNNKIDLPFESSEEDDNIVSEKTKVTTKLSDEEISKLNTKKCGYGQGLRLDENNRPYRITSYNVCYTKLLRELK